MNELVADVRSSKKLLEPFNDLAIKLFPNLDQKDALEKLSTRLDNIGKEVSSGQEKIKALSSELLTEKKTIKTFEALVYIEFTGQWTETPYPDWSQPPAPRPYLRWRDKSKKLPDIEFCSPKINYKTLSKNTGVFENNLTVLPGKNPLGTLTDILSSYNQMNFWFLLSQPRYLTDSHIQVTKVKIIFFINGLKIGQIVSDEKVDIDLSESLKNANENSQINPSLTLDGKLVDLIK